MFKGSVAVPMVAVVSSPLMVRMKGFAFDFESPETVNVLAGGMMVEFKAILDGLKEQVAPEVHDRATVSVKVLGVEGAKVTVKVVASVPMGRDCVRVGEVRLKIGFPVPVKVMLEAPLATLSVTVRVPVRTPVLVGVKVIRKVQVAFWASVKGVEGQLLVSAKGPVVAMLVTVKGVSPLLVMYTVWAGLRVFIV